MYRQSTSTNFYEHTYNGRPTQESGFWTCEELAQASQRSRKSFSGEKCSGAFLDDRNSCSSRSYELPGLNSAGPIGGDPTLQRPPAWQERIPPVDHFAEKGSLLDSVEHQPEESIEMVIWFSRRPWMEVPQTLFLDWATKDKVKSIALQLFIDSCPPEILAIVGELSLQNIEFLVVHRQGSYVVQKIVSRSPLFRKFIGISLSMAFEEYVQNEFSSRVLEKLAAMSDNFRNLTIKLFCKNWEQLIRNLPAVMFLCGCIKSMGDNSGLEMVRSHLLENQDLLFTSKRYKRVLVVFAEVCSQRDLDNIFKGLMKQKDLMEILDDKLLVAVMVEMIKRGLPGAINLLLEAIWWNLPALIDCKHFKQIFLDLIPEQEKLIRDKFSNHVKLLLSLRQECQTKGTKLHPPEYREMAQVCSKLVTQYARRETSKSYFPAPKFSYPIDSHQWRPMNRFH